MNVSKKKTKIGCLLPLTGPESRHARAQMLASQLALEEMTPNLDLPCDVELVIEDEAFDPQKAADIAQKFAADEDILAVIGPMNSKTNLAAAPIFHQAGLAHIATAASNPDLSRHGWQTFFRVVVNDIHQYSDAARYAVRILKANHIAVVFSAGGTFSIPMAEGFRRVAQQLGANIPVFLGIDGQNLDYSDAVEELKAVDLDLIFFVVGEDTATAIAGQLRQAGVMTPFFATDGIKPFPYFATPEYSVDGPYYTNVCADPQVRPEAGEMVKRYLARFGEKPTVYMAEAYDAAGIILTALQRLKADQLTRNAVCAEIAATHNYPGVSGALTFDEYGDLVNPAIGIYKVERKELRFLGFTNELLSAQNDSIK